MRSIQFVGPYAARHSETVSLGALYKILQIGIEHPHSIPIQEYENTETEVQTIIKIDGIDYAVCDNDILEIPGLYQSSLTFSFPESVNEYVIIDVAFKDISDE